MNGSKGVLTKLACSGLLLLFVLAACGRGESIDDKAMENMLYEVFVARAVVEQSDSLRGRFVDTTLEVYAPIAARYGYTMGEFDSMLAVYSREPKRLDAILDRIIARVEQEKEAIATTDTLPGEGAAKE